MARRRQKGQDQLSTQHTGSTSWKPQPGDSITGRIEDISEHDAGYGTYPILELATDAGTVSVHCFHDVLKNELARLAPDIGDTLTITYQGKHLEKGYHRYRVRDGDGVGHGINWSRYGSPDTQPLKPEPGAGQEGDDDIPF